MNMVETWHLIFEGFTAIGTVGAVIISLWLTLNKRHRFTIKNIRMYRLIKVDKSEENKLFITFENHQVVQMEIHSIILEFLKKKDNSGPSQKWFFKKEYVQPLSQSEIEIPLERNWESGLLQSSDNIILKFKTSFGDKTMSFPKKLKSALCESLEIASNNNPERQ